MDHPNVMRFHQAWMETTPSSETASTATTEGSTSGAGHAADYECPEPPPSSPRLRTPGVKACGPSSASGEWRPPASSDDESHILFAADSDEPPAYEEHRWGDAQAKPKKGGKAPSTKNSAEKKAAPPEDECGTQVALHIALELCRESNLLSWIANRNAMCKGKDPGEDARCLQAHKGLSIFIQCARALAHLHEQSCVHRDVKPANILFAPDGKVRLGDFGLAKILPASEVEAIDPSEPLSPDAEHATRNVGTPSYAGPEQLDGRVLGPSADVYSLGVALLELLCPFPTHMERASVLENLRERREVPAAVALKFPTLATLVVSMTDPDPAKRPTPWEILSLTKQANREVRRVRASERAAKWAAESRPKSTESRKWVCSAALCWRRRCCLHHGLACRRSAATQRRAEMFRARSQKL